MTDARSHRRWLLAILTVILAAAAFAVGCGGSDDGSTDGANGSTSDGSTASATVRPGEGGTLTWVVSSITGWDPVLSAAYYDNNILALVYDSLTRLDPEGNATPGMASWTYSDDGRVLTLKLVDGITFSDGATFDAEAVKVNIERAKTAEGSTAAASLASIDSVKVVDPLTAELHLSKVDYQLPQVFGGRYGMMVSPKAIAEDAKALATRPVGSGPFTLTKYAPGATVSVKRNPDYREADQILLAGIDAQVVSNQQTRFSGLLSGETDFAWITGQQMDAARAAGLHAEVFPSLTNFHIMVNPRVKPFDNAKLLEAIDYALDRPALIRAWASGIGEPISQFFPPGYIAYDPNTPPTEHDLDRAKQLLAESGYDGEEIVLYGHGSYLNYPALLEQIQGQLKEAGINVRIEGLQYADILERAYVKREFPFFSFSSLGRESPLAALEAMYGKDGLLNPCRCESPEVRKALDKVAMTPIDDPEYARVLQAASGLAARMSPHILLFTGPQPVAYSDKVHGLKGWINFQRFEQVSVSE